MKMVGTRFTRLLPLLLAGCGAPTGTVGGTVTYDGQPVTFGQVAFLSESGAVAQGTIDSKGRYRIPRAPIGKVRVSVTILPPPPAVVRPDAAPGTASTPPAYLAISEQRKEELADPDRSGLEYTVTHGEQEHPISIRR